MWIGCRDEERSLLHIEWQDEVLAGDRFRNEFEYPKRYLEPREPHRDVRRREQLQQRLRVADEQLRTDRESRADVWDELFGPDGPFAMLEASRCPLVRFDLQTDEVRPSGAVRFAGLLEPVGEDQPRRRVGGLLQVRAHERV